MSENSDAGTDHCSGGTERSLLCRFGLHNWSTNRGGIKVCLRDGCRKARTYGLTGIMRKMEFKEDLYEDYQRYTESDTDRNGGN